MAEDKTTCTCKQCFEGWLSPRMKERLQSSTELRYGLAKDLLDTQDSVGEDVTSVLPIDYARIEISYHYLPSEVRDKIEPSRASESESAPSGDAIFRGYVAVFKAIKDLAGDDRKDFPSASAVAAKLAELRDGSEEDASAKLIAAFLDNGGKAEHALDCIVDRACEELSPLGRQYDPENQYIDGLFADDQEECANDLAFALVRAKLGLPAETLGVFPEGEEDSRDPPSDDEEES